MAYIYFQKCGIFKSALNKWDENDDDIKTWLTFKDHFWAAHKTIKRTGALTIQETLNRDSVANMVQEEIQQVFAAAQDPQEIIDITDIDNGSTNTPSVPAATTTTNSSTSTVASDLTMQMMQQQLAMMQQLILQQMVLTQQPLCQPTSAAEVQKKKRKWNQMKYC